MAALLSFISAMSFGVSDYLGGSLSRKEQVLRVTASSQAAVAVIYLSLAFFLPVAFSLKGLLFGCVAGVASVTGLSLFYRALADGVVGIVASVTAIFTALLPALFGYFLGDTYSMTLLIGIAVALIAVLALSFPSQSSKEMGMHHKMTIGIWATTIGGGIGLATSLITLSRTPSSSGYWPLVGIALAGVPLSAGLAGLKTGRAYVSRTYIKPILIMAAVTALAYVAQLFSLRHGLLAVASVVGALYPLPTIILAWVIDKEKLTPLQLAGSVLSLVAIVIIALS